MRNYQHAHEVFFICRLCDFFFSNTKTTFFSSKLFFDFSFIPPKKTEHITKAENEKKGILSLPKLYKTKEK